MDDFIEQIEPKGFVHKKDLTMLDDLFLVKGSKNVLVNDGDKIVTRKGYTLLGSAGESRKGIKSSYDWESSNGRERNLRTRYDKLQVYYDGDWRDISTGWGADTPKSFSPIWDTTELIDVLVMCNGTDSLWDWSGLITKVQEVSSNTITKQGWYEGTKIAFHNNGATGDTITDLDEGFVDAGFAVGDTLKVTGTTFNDGTYTILTVTAGTITLADEDELTDEALGSTFTLRNQDGTWAEARALTSGTRKVLINGTEFTYTGGEGTGKLTGVTPDPTDDEYNITNGDYVSQALRENTDTPAADFNTDFLSTLENQLYCGSNTSNNVYASSNDDYTDFTFSTPREPGEGAKFTLDGRGKGFAPDEKTMYITAGRDHWYEVDFFFTDDNLKERSEIRRLKTAPLQAAVSHDAIWQMPNHTVFLTAGKIVEELSRIENVNTPNSKPISDPIKLEIESYNTTDVHGVVWRNSLYILFPEEGKMLIFDMERGFWQPPLHVEFSRLAIIDDWLHGHASGADETYRMFDGYTDNGSAIEHVAVLPYDSFGERFALKNFEHSATELYMSSNTIVKKSILYDYLGSTTIKEIEIDGSDEDITFSVPVQGGLGKEKLGTNPLGSVLDDPVDMAKVRHIKKLERTDFFERQIKYSSGKKEDRWELLAGGEDIQISTNRANQIIK